MSQVFDAIVQSNGWDDATGALQVLSHLEGDALNVALLVPETRRVTHVGLVGALTAHYGSPGRLVDYRRQFEKTTRQPEEDPSIFAIALETLAVKTFGDLGNTARLRIIRDRFIAGHASCELRRHLDSVAPETPIRDIVDRCRVWESHADSDYRKGRRHGPERALHIYMVGDGWDDQPVAAVTTSPTAPKQLESLLRWLLPTQMVPPKDPTPIPSELEQMLQRLLGGGGGWEDCNHYNGDFAAKFASCQSVLEFANTAVFLVWKNRSWGDPMSYNGCVISFLAAVMEGGEGREQIRDDLSSCGSGAPPGGKWQLVRGGGQPPGSVMELYPRTLVVLRHGSLLPENNPIPDWQWNVLMKWKLQL